MAHMPFREGIRQRAVPPALCGPRARGPPPHIPAETGPGCECRRPRGPGRGPTQAPARPAGQGTPSPHTPVCRQRRRRPRPGAPKSQSEQPGHRAAGRCGTARRARPRPSPRETITIATLGEKTPPRNQSCYDVLTEIRRIQRQIPSLSKKLGNVTHTQGTEVQRNSVGGPGWGHGHHDSGAA